MTAPLAPAVGAAAGVVPRRQVWLAIAKEIVTAHGGTISAESGPERTVFTVTLPS